MVPGTGPPPPLWATRAGVSPWLSDSPSHNATTSKTPTTPPAGPFQCLPTHTLGIIISLSIERTFPMPQRVSAAPRRCPPLSPRLSGSVPVASWRRRRPGHPLARFPQASGRSSPWRSHGARRPSPAAAGPPSGCRNGPPRGAG